MASARSIPLEVEGPLVRQGDGWACRAGCGACCIALSISSPIPGMPNGKPAGIRCIQLTDDNYCAMFGKEGRPGVCERLRPEPQMCGETRQQALSFIDALEKLTAPVASIQTPKREIALGNQPVEPALLLKLR